MEEVTGSIPVRSTKQPPQNQRFTEVIQQPFEVPRVLKGA
jgi:hypothetical protein